MNPEDSVTEEGWRPLGVQCHVHCTPLIQASARAAADRSDGWREEGVETMCVPGEAGPWSRVVPGVNDVHFGFLSD